MNEVKNKRIAGVLFFCAGVGHIIVAMLSHQVVWFGLAAVSFMAGAIFLAQARSAR